MYDELFQPLKIGSVEVPNRIAMMAMGVFSERLQNPDGSYTKDGADYYIERAKCGTGLIITGLIGVYGYTSRPFINRDPENYIKNQRYLCDGVHKYGSKIFVQLTAGVGRVGDNVVDPVAPSAIPNVWDPTLIHRPLTIDEIHNIIKKFGEGAHVAQQAGADGVEIHAVHEGYLLDQFATGFYNHRTDEYGGSLENRLRITTEIIQEIKRVCGKDFAVAVRYSVRSMVKDWNRGALPGEEFEEKGRDIEESIQAAKILEAAGCDALDCDNGTHDSWYWCHPPVYMPDNCNLPDSIIIKHNVNIPVISAGNFTDPALASKCIREGDLDMMGMGRQLLADPETPMKFKAGQLDDIRPCIKCHMGCYGHLYLTKEEGNDISCALNPACGREKELTLVPTDIPKRILVVGGGIAGMEAARVAALRGHRVEIMEKTDKLGGAFIAAAAPSFKNDDRKLLKWYEKKLKEAGVVIRLNTTVTKETIAKGNYDHVFVATGATERKLQDSFLQTPKVMYAKEALLADEVPGDNVLVIGGGLTGCEIAYELSLRGKKVSIAEMTPSILNVRGLSAANSNMLLDLIDYYKIPVYYNTKIADYDGKTAVLSQRLYDTLNCHGRPKLKTGAGPRGVEKIHKIPVDTIVISIGYISDNKLYESIKGDNVTLLGDADHPANVMNAVWQAYDVAMKI